MSPVDRTNYCGDYEYRFVAACGLERRLIYSQYWSRVHDAEYATMTPTELRHIANVIDRKAA